MTQKNGCLLAGLLYMCLCVESRRIILLKFFQFWGSFFWCVQVGILYRPKGKKKNKRRKNRRAIFYFLFLNFLLQKSDLSLSLISPYCIQQYWKEKSRKKKTPDYSLHHIFPSMYVTMCSNRGERGGGLMCPTINKSNMSVLQIGKDFITGKIKRKQRKLPHP